MKTIQEDTLPATALDNTSENLSDSANTRPAKFRFLRAFGVTFGILISLGFFHLLGKFFGTEWENSRRPAIYGKNARRLRRLLLSLQGIFIKAGQLISILSNFLPDYFRRELEELASSTMLLIPGAISGSRRGGRGGSANLAENPTTVAFDNFKLWNIRDVALP
jgi:hypothetical protein